MKDSTPCFSCVEWDILASRELGVGVCIDTHDCGPLPFNETFPDEEHLQQ